MDTTSIMGRTAHVTNRPRITGTIISHPGPTIAIIQTANGSEHPYFLADLTIRPPTPRELGLPARRSLCELCAHRLPNREP